jgi:NhaA family Na+:H+ antiporter
LGGAVLAGIGFTVALFIADLSFGGTDLAEAKLAILGASITAGILGALILKQRPQVATKPLAGHTQHVP